jgi:hypothetical protein
VRVLGLASVGGNEGIRVIANAPGPAWWIGYGTIFGLAAFLVIVGVGFVIDRATPKPVGSPGGFPLDQP